MTIESDRRRATIDRRRLVWLGGGMLASLALPRRARGLAQAGKKVVREESWADVVELGEGVWAVVSKPLGGDYKTVCNGGLIAGRDRVLAVDAYMGAEGAGWVAEVAEQLAGRRPTDVVLTHFHGDHANGLGGFATPGAAPRAWVTSTTRELLADLAARDEAAAGMLETAQLIGEDEPSTLDLGGREARLEPRVGHTPSDVTVVVPEAGVRFFGDLVWNRMFPNYMSALPSRLGASVRAARDDKMPLWVPGHGPLPEGAEIDLDPFVALIDDVEAAARRAHEKGMTAAAAAAEYQLPESVASWTLFNPSYFETAISAWLRELEG